MSASYKRNIISNLITQYSNTVIGFISSIFTTRMLSDYGRGEMALYTNFVSLSVLFFSFSLSTGVIYFVSSGTISPLRVLNISLLYFFSAFFLLLLIVLGLDSFHDTDFILSKNNQQLSIYLICSSSFFFTSLNTIVTAIFNGLKKIVVINKIVLLFTLLNLAILLMLFYSGFYLNKSAFLIVILLQLGTLSGQFLFFFLYLKRHIRKNDYPHATTLREDFRKLFRFSIVVYLTNLMTFFAYKMDVWIVDYYVGKSQLGIYSLAVSLAQLLWLLPNAIAYINLAEVSGQTNKESSKNLTLLSFKAAFYFSIVGGIGLLILSYLFIPKLYGMQFAEAPYYILLLLIGVVPFSSATIISSYLAGINKYRHNLVAVIIGLIICIVFDFTLIPLFGVKGACIASSLSYLAICIYLTIYLKREIRVSYKELFFFRREHVERAKLLLQKRVFNR